MQISIDANTATPTALRLTAAILTFIAGFKENPQTAGLPIPQIMPTPVVPPAPLCTCGEVDEGPKHFQDCYYRTYGEKYREPLASPLPPVSGGGTLALVDSANVVWNPEQHTANQSKNTDGTWRHKRTSKGEMSAAPKIIELPKSPQVPPPPSSAPTVEPVLTVPPVPTAVGVPTSSAVPPAPPVSTVSSSPLAELGGDTFAALVKYATNLVGAKKISTVAMLAACNECGVADIHACSKPENAALIPLVAAAISKRLPK